MGETSIEIRANGQSAIHMLASGHSRQVPRSGTAEIGSRKQVAAQRTTIQKKLSSGMNTGVTAAQLNASMPENRVRTAENANSQYHIR